LCKQAGHDKDDGFISFSSQSISILKEAPAQPNGLVRRIGPFDATMIVMGGIIGAGIFMNPASVARVESSPALILAAWAVGGLIALGGAFVYAELSSQKSEAGGQYAYLREAYHPAVGFIYGWALLLVIQTGGMAAVAITFAKYFLELAHRPATDLNTGVVAVTALGLLTIINCLGVRAGSTVQSILMVLKILAIAGLVVFGLTVSGREPALALDPNGPQGISAFTVFGAAMIPVLFAYGGWQTSCFIAGEVREPRRNLPRALLWGVLGVIVIYLSVNFVCVSVLGAKGLAATQTPASAVMRIALGDTGARLIAIGIAISTLGFLSQSILTAPRVYFAMAEHGVFFRSVARLSSRHVPVLAIILQGVAASIIALSGRYDQILNYVVSVDFIFFGLTATCIFVFRRRSTGTASFRVPGHPITTLLFIAACWIVVANVIYTYPRNSLIGVLIMLSGLPVYYFWSRKRTTGW
jgi:APA family basic amino acid/polyamine antiporter